MLNVRRFQKYIPTAKGYFAILLSVLLGLVVLMSVQLSGIHNSFLTSIIIIALFAIINFFSARIFQLMAELKNGWSIRTIIYLVYGTIAGLLIAAIPNLLGFVFGAVSSANPSPQINISFTAASTTLLIVAWEEIWFRGIYLNYSKKYLSATNISVTVGLLFMLMHTMNPAVNITQVGPTLFFAGALLTILYLHYRTIWLPIGVHFGNNFYNSAVKFTTPPGTAWDSDGYATALLLACLFAFFALKHRSSRREPMPVYDSNILPS